MRVKKWTAPWYCHYARVFWNAPFLILGFISSLNRHIQKHAPTRWITIQRAQRASTFPSSPRQNQCTWLTLTSSINPEGELACHVMGSLLYNFRGHPNIQTRTASKALGDLPSKYYLGHTLLNLSYLTGTGVSKVLCPSKVQKSGDMPAGRQERYEERYVTTGAEGGLAL